MPDFKFIQDPDDPESWIDESCALSGSRAPVAITVITGGPEPSAACKKMIQGKLRKLERTILSSAELVLENYSFEHYKNLGVDESLLLREETASAMAKVVTLESMWFYDEEGETYELSFTVPWDSEHTYDVEIEEDEATSCSVNG